MREDFEPPPPRVTAFADAIHFVQNLELGTWKIKQKKKRGTENIKYYTKGRESFHLTMLDFPTNQLDGGM